MKARILFVMVLGLSVIFTSCEKIGNSVKPSDTITTETRSVSGFDGIKVSSAFNVYVTFSETEENIEVEANENLQEYIEVFEQNSNLIIKIKDHINIRGSKTKLNIYVTTSDISYYDASDASNIVLQNKLISDKVTIGVSDASNFTGTIVVTDLYCNLTDASNIFLTGTSKQLHLNVKDASNFKDYSFATDYLDAELSDASNAFITINEELSVKASDASNLKYKGNGVIKDINVSDASGVKKVN